MRHIDTIIIHCSGTPEGREHNAADIKRWHLQRGWKDIGYHFVVKIDGTVELGRPIDQVGAHAKGHNANSIGICYVGGCDKNMKAKDTLTDAQQASIQSLIIDMKNSYPITKLIGHNEVSSKSCPSFVVKDKFAL